MDFRLWRFSSIMLTSLFTSAAVAHVLELPPKMRFEPSLYVKLHRTLYPNFGRIAGVAEILALLSTGGLGWRLRRQRAKAFPLTAVAAGSLAAAHAAFWTLVSPANKTMASWPLDSIPPDWTGWRAQWEYTHAVRAVLGMAALSTLVWSALQADVRRAGVTTTAS